LQGWTIDAERSQNIVDIDGHTQTVRVTRERLRDGAVVFAAAIGNGGWRLFCG